MQKTSIPLFLTCLLLVMTLFTSCQKQEPINIEPQLVVEGYIDSGGFPVVMVTTSIAINSYYKESIDSLGNHLLRWARVAVSDGEQEVILSGKYDSSFLPPYVYTTTKMIGEPGKSYTLTVDYKQYHATAVTTIPAVPAVDSIWVKPVIPDSLCNIIVTFTDAANERNYYKAFVKRGMRGRQWLPSYLTTINDEVLGSGSSELVVNQAGIVLDDKDYVPYFSYNDTVSVKFAQIDEAAYRFWKDFDNSTNFSRNPFFPITTSLHSNVNGGMGCWFGCGAVTCSFMLENYR